MTRRRRRRARIERNRWVRSVVQHGGTSCTAHALRQMHPGETWFSELRGPARRRWRRRGLQAARRIVRNIDAIVAATSRTWIHEVTAYEPMDVLAAAAHLAGKVPQ